VLYTLPSECEVYFVLHGSIEVQVQHERFAPEAGGALTFGNVVARSWSATNEGARMLWILASGLPVPEADAR
jgi:hypothetical protein